MKNHDNNNSKKAAANQLIVKIRPMKNNEINDLFQLQEFSIRTLTSQDYNHEQIEAILNKNSRSSLFVQGTITFVAECNNQTVGFTTLNKIYHRIDAVFVHPHYAYQGIGKKLMLTLEQEALSSKIKQLTVLASLTSVGFYKSLGYQYQNKVELSAVKIKVPCAFMTKQLLPFNTFEQLCATVISLFVFGN
ncbi:GNAT family N-acetyltransferase [Nostoc sp. PCC 7107]|uniref:GNAT family N-acetyltransferase n=1 Tax=Nostoc sp. PCC 7107 TaxID=317936 RepID=UPI00029EFFEE|nr:GNAT family N-acetyltransferase [Nostoc sp. PCC 7107]AFY42553.1 GCN5-related N-acetyltransferase [Nostoc sp. PCC 7107]